MYMIRDSTLRATQRARWLSVFYHLWGLFVSRVVLLPRCLLWVRPLCVVYKVSQVLSFHLRQTAALKVCCRLSPSQTTNLPPFKACMQNSPFLSMQHLHFHWQLSALQHRHLVCAVSWSTEPQHKTLPSLIHYFLKQCKWVNNFSTFNHRHNSQVWVRIQVLERKSHFDRYDI